MKTFNISFFDFSSDMYLRNDVKYHNFLNNIGWNIFNVRNYIKLKEILISDYKKFIFQDNEEYYGIPTGQSYIDEDGYIIDNQPITKEEHPDRLKYKINKDNILISSLRLARSPALNFEDIDFEKNIFSNGFYIFKLKENWNKKFVLYLLRNKKIKYIIDNCIYRGIGISAYKDTDLLNLKLPLIPISTQNSIVEKIIPIENNIKELKSQIKDIRLIINEVFANEFGFDVNLYNEFGKGMTAGTQIADDRPFRVFSSNFCDFANSDGLRFSTRYHNETIRKLIFILKKIKTKKLSKILTLIEKGVQPEYDTDGNFKVIKITNLKNSYIDFEDCENVNEMYFNSVKMEKRLKKDDIILCCTGKISLGKIDLVDVDDDLITSIDNVIIRVKNYNRLFLVYFFRSILGYFQIERDYTGTTNQIHLYPLDISNFLIPDISLDRQQIIVDKIKAEIDKQEEIKKSIALERQKIDDLVQSVL